MEISPNNNYVKILQTDYFKNLYKEINDYLNDQRFSFRSSNKSKQDIFDYLNFMKINCFINKEIIEEIENNTKYRNDEYNLCKILSLISFNSYFDLNKHNQLQNIITLEDWKSILNDYDILSHKDLYVAVLNNILSNVTKSNNQSSQNFKEIFNVDFSEWFEFIIDLGIKNKHFENLEYSQSILQTDYPPFLEILKNKNLIFDNFSYSIFEKILENNNFQTQQSFFNKFNKQILELDFEYIETVLSNSEEKNKKDFDLSKKIMEFLFKFQIYSLHNIENTNDNIANDNLYLYNKFKNNFLYPDSNSKYIIDNKPLHDKFLSYLFESFSYSQIPLKDFLSNINPSIERGHFYSVSHSNFNNLKSYSNNLNDIFFILDKHANFIPKNINETYFENSIDLFNYSIDDIKKKLNLNSHLEKKDKEEQIKIIYFNFLNSLISTYDKLMLQDSNNNIINNVNKPIINFIEQNIDKFLYFPFHDSSGNSNKRDFHFIKMQHKLNYFIEQHCSDNIKSILKEYSLANIQNMKKNYSYDNFPQNNHINIMYDTSFFDVKLDIKDYFNTISINKKKSNSRSYSQTLKQTVFANEYLTFLKNDLLNDLTFSQVKNHNPYTNINSYKEEKFKSFIEYLFKDFKKISELLKDKEIEKNIQNFFKTVNNEKFLESFIQELQKYPESFNHFILKNKKQASLIKELFPTLYINVQHQLLQDKVSTKLENKDITTTHKKNKI